MGGVDIEYISKLKESENEKVVKDTFKDLTFNLSKNNNVYNLIFETQVNEKYLSEFKAVMSVKDSNFNIIRQSVISPTVGTELAQKTLIAICISIITIFVFVAYAFKNINSAFSAILAMLHDTFIIIGFYSFFCHFYGAKVDLLFFTAVLTTLSFSLYDTIVVFDKIRENTKSPKFKNTADMLDYSIKQTFVRSLNNSLTIVLVIFTLLLFVEGPLYWFALSLLLGVIFGTYSSPFVAVPLFYDLRKLKKLFRF